MPAKNLSRINEDGIYLHIYNKGIENRAIFNDKDDYEVFIEYLKEYLTSPKDPKTQKQAFKVKGRTFQGTPHLPKNYFNQIELIAYNLAADHFHLVLQQVSKGSVEKFLRSLSTRYSIYFNKKYQHTGALFAGPYKSVQIEAGLRLSHLTRYLHLMDEYTSYPEYLGQRQTAWVKPEAVLHLFDKGVSSYKNFVERDLPEENLLLEKTILETKTAHLERSLPKKEENQIQNSKADSISKDIKPDQIKTRSSLPEFITVSVSVFLLLLTLGVGNIKLSEAKSSQSASTTPPVVLSETKEIASKPEEVRPENSPEATVAAIPENSPEPEPKSTVTILINDGASSVNIRQQATINSAKIAQAKDGEVFELISKQKDWFEIKLASQSGFISAKYIKEEE
jgi:hypothetical protein